MSIRLRLALWYGALLAIVLTATLTFAFVAHARTHEADVDASLTSSWQHAVTELVGSAMPMMQAASLTAPSQAASAPTATWLLMGDRRVAAGDAADAVLARFDPAAVADGLQDVTVAGTRVRSYGAVVPGTSTRLVVAASMSSFDASLRNLALILALMGIGGVALAVTAGWAISGSALRPIARMSETARAIEISRGFARRIEVSADGRDELDELGRTFNHMLCSLDDAFRRQQRFVADVSHELRTPLTALQGDLELLARGALPPSEAASALKEARRETHRLARLIDDLLVLARADAGPQPLIAKPVQLDEVVMDVFRELRGSAGSRLHVRDLDPAVIPGERDRLKQLVLILVDNALRYTAAPGEVDVRLQRERGVAILTIDDEGVGISPADAAHVFERFYRAEAAARLDPSGTGLGLSIARWITERHGGSIELLPRLPHGTRAVVRLPDASGADAELAA